MASESEANFVHIGGPELVSKFVGESEEKLRQIFKDAQENAPSIIFMDEIDAIAPKREEATGEVERRMVSQLLTLMDGLQARGQVIVIGASVTGDTPILVKYDQGTRLVEIGKFIDPFYKDGEADEEREVEDVFALGFDGTETRFKSKLFRNSAFKKVGGVFRHKVSEIHEIRYRGGVVKATGNHSVFVRTRQGVVAKPVSELSKGEVLVEIPFKVQKSDGELPLIRSHVFPRLDGYNLSLPVSKAGLLREAYSNAQASATMEEYGQIAVAAGVSLSTVQGWHAETHVPKLLQTQMASSIPSEVTVSQELARLLGYYAAEGYARKEVDFCFGTHETTYHADLTEKMRKVFGAKPDVRVAGSRTNIIYASKLLAWFFSTQCGKGAHNKHVPQWLFEAPREIFTEFLYGYLCGDGCRLEGDKRGYQATSVSRQLILELNWLCRMHGIKSSISTFSAKAGREINGRRIEKATKAWRLLIGGTNDPFAPSEGKRQHIKRPIIQSIRKIQYDGYVYDLCGCDNEAFFGGESPLLLHNTNRPNSIDQALRRPGRFDREVELGVPDRQGRKEILQIHTRSMPLDDGLLFSTEPKIEKIKSGLEERKVMLKDFDIMEKFLKSEEASLDLYSRDGAKKYRLKREGDKVGVYEGGVNLDEIAAITHGYTGADISSLTKEAAMKVLRRILPKIDLEQEFIPTEILDNLRVTREDFFNALREIRPSALREVFIERPNIKWTDIGGLDNVKKELKEAVELPLKSPEVFARMGIRPVKGILLVGLPGTGKTMFAKAVATETEANFITIKGPEVLSKWVGESEKAVRETFRKARMATPCVIFIDEIDSIAPHRGAGDDGNRVTERVVDTLLTEMDGLTGLKNVVVIAATNRPELLDMALLRGGRFDRIIEIPPPEEKTRLEIFRIHSRSMPLGRGLDFEELARKTDGYTGADIENTCREAGMVAIRRGVDVKEVTKADFEEALSVVKPSITKAYVDKIKKFAKGEINSMYR